METLIPVTWLYATVGASIFLWVVSVIVAIRNFSLVNQWRDQCFCLRELANNRRNIIEAQRVRLNRSLAAIREIGQLVKNSTFEQAVTHICQEAAKIPPDLEVPEDAVNRELEVLRKKAQEIRVVKKQEFGDPNDSYAGGSCT